MVTDPIADMLAKIMNAIKAHKNSVEVKASNMKLRIVEILKDEGFIEDFSVIEDNKQNIIKIDLRYNKKQSVINSMTKISKPGRRVYKPYKDITSSKNHRGIYIISTSQGIVSDKIAVKNKLGGEIICEVW